MQINRELQDIAKRVHHVLKEEFPIGGGGEKIDIGADGDLTYEIDRLAENTILELIDKKEFDWNIHSEEAGEINKGSNLTLIVDPVDGTHNAISAIPFYSTSLALLDETSGEVKEAVVMNLATGQIYHATKDEGAFRDEKPIHVRPMIIKEAVVSSYIGPEARKWAYELMNWPMRIRYFGSISLEVCLVASGSLDMFVMFGRIPRLTDIAASTLILKEAGGNSFIIDKRNLITPFQPRFNRLESKAFLSMGDPISLRSVLEISKVDHVMEDLEK